MNQPNFEFDLKPSLALYLVTDERMPWDECLAAVQQAVHGGVTMVQLRCKKISKDQITSHSKDLLTVLAPKKIPLILNDHTDLVRSIGAQGIHLGKSDCRPEEARRLLGSQSIIGLSVASVGEFLAAQWRSCDYISASPVFATSTKDDTDPPVGLSELKKLRSVCPIPLIAIGGITPLNAKALWSFGVDGICVVSAILHAQNPKIAAESLRHA